MEAKTTKLSSPPSILNCLLASDLVDCYRVIVYLPTLLLLFLGLELKSLPFSSEKTKAKDELVSDTLPGVVPPKKLALRP